MGRMNFDAENWAELRPLHDYWYYTLGDDDYDYENSPHRPPFPSTSLDRKCRLLVVAAFRVIWHTLPDPRCRVALEFFEQFADDLDCAKNQHAESLAAQVAEEWNPVENGRIIPRNGWEGQLTTFVHSAVSVDDDRNEIVDHIRYKWVNLLDELSGNGSAEWLDKVSNDFRLFHDIFGNPFRPVTLDPAWRTSTVLALAQGIYDGRVFDRMPILADALQDAGCDNADILTHCRDPQQVHVRGCWVVDLVLGKE